VRASDREGTRRGNKSEWREKTRGEERGGRIKEEEREEDAYSVCVCVCLCMSVHVCDRVHVHDV
jgi:hypothetical protein